MGCSYRQSLVLLTGLVIFILFSGCTSAPEDQPAQSPATGSDYSSSIHYEKISFGDAIEMLENDPEYMDLNGSRLCQMTGSGVDISGNATSWMLGVCNDTGSQLLVCDMHGWRQMEWPGVLPGDVIDLNEIFSPEELYAEAGGLLISAMREADVDEGELSLSGTEYSITLISDGRLKTLYFDALTGEEVSSA